MYVASVFYLDVAHVTHICYQNMFKMFQLFQSYDAISVYMLQVANIFFERTIRDLRQFLLDEEKEKTKYKETTSHKPQPGSKEMPKHNSKPLTTPRRKKKRQQSTPLDPSSAKGTTNQKNGESKKLLHWSENRNALPNCTGRCHPSIEKRLPQGV